MDVRLDRTMGIWERMPKEFITSLSVAVALIIGTVELVGVLADRLHIESGPMAAIAAINLDFAGYLIVGLFIVSWLVAVLVWKFGRIEDRWSSIIFRESTRQSSPRDCHRLGRAPAQHESTCPRTKFIRDDDSAR